MKSPDRAQVIYEVILAEVPHLFRSEARTLAVKIENALLQREADDDAEFHVRKEAPETSHAIVDAIRAGTLQHAMLYLFADSWREYQDGFTDDELERRLGRSHQSVSATRNTLVRKGYLRDSGALRKTRYGNDSIVWVWTEKRPADTRHF